MKTKPKHRGFTLIELMVVITIIALLASFAMPAYRTIQENGKISKVSSNARQIVLACKAFASDNDGVYPSFTPAEEGGGEGGELATATDAFNLLLDDGYIDQEGIFWTQTTNPEKQVPPNEDGELEQKEVSFVYVKGQTDTSYSRSPLVADEQESPGTYGEFHPWLSSKKAVVGYCGGNVAVEKLSTNKPGAVVRDRSGKEIFKERTSEEGESGGYLDTKQDNVLLP